MTVMRDAVVKALVDMRVQGDKDGLIPAYNVLGNLLPTTFWNIFAERIMEAAPAERHDEVEEGLIRCAQECAYHTGYGIINSPEFKAVVEPMVTEGAKDILRGAYAVFTAWGWAKSGITSFKEGESMTIRAVDYYEADSGGRGLRAYLIRGASAAFFELAFGGDYSNNKTDFKFGCKQTYGIETGDKYGEFVVTAV